jgi:hypothetical protein
VVAPLAIFGACANLLTACQNLSSENAPLGVTTRAVSDQDYHLTPPWLGKARGIIFIHGKICRLRASETYLPQHIQVTGYDKSGNRLFRREIPVKPFTEHDDLCHRYVGNLAGILMPSEIQVSATAAEAQ